MEQTFNFKKTSVEKLIEKVVDDNNVAINHMILNKGEALPTHNANSNVYMIVVRGTVTLHLEENPDVSYSAGNIVNIPYDTKMDVKNTHDEQLEFFVVKSPNPKFYGAK